MQLKIYRTRVLHNSDITERHARRTSVRRGTVTNMAGQTIRILYDGKLALTTAQFAERHGLTMETARKTLSRLGVDPLPDQLDGRTKLWPATPTDRAMKARPGKGANLKGHG